VIEAGMFTEIGHVFAFLGLGLALAQAGFGLMAPRWGGPALAAAERSALLSFLFVGLSFLILVRAFLVSDFSLAVVADNSHTLKPVLYKFAGTWGNHEGSMLLWCWIMTGFAAAAATTMKTAPARFKARALGVQGLLTFGFLLYLLAASNPFFRLDPAPLQGSDLNPLLQDPALAAHPPLLYVGYVGFSFVFSLAAAGMMEGRIDSAWARSARPWTLISWAFLTIGILLGSYWAYYELGWGGWWFWDPVENASFIPWLVGAALLHSLIVTEKREGFAAWSAFLAVLAFCCSLLGAFLVRSGVLTSVHAFALDPERGMLLLGGLGVAAGFAFSLFAWRAPNLQHGPAFAMTSRDGMLALNNLVFAVSAATVLFGTLYPLIAEAFGARVSVGTPYFNLTFGPLMGALLVLAPVAPFLAWRKGDFAFAIRQLKFALGLSLAGAAVIGTLWGAPIWAYAGTALGLWLIMGGLADLWRRIRTGRGADKGRIRLVTASIWGMTLAHVGVGVFVLGATLEISGRQEATYSMAPGDVASIGQWQLRLEGVRAEEGPNYYADRAIITVLTGSGEELGTLIPERRFYPAAGIPTTEVAIRKKWGGDIYLALGDPGRGESAGRWTVRAYFNPLIDLVFIGMLMMGLGGFTAFAGRREQQRVAALQSGARVPDGVKA